jgi:plastocyanin
MNLGGRAATAVAGLMVVIASGSPAAASGGGGCGGPVTNERGTSVSIDQYCFTPTVLYADVDDTVTFTNEDGVPHTISGANLAWGSFEQLRGGRAVRYSFSSPGVYAYVCVLHPGMVGAVVVGEPVAGGITDANAVRRIKAVNLSQDDPLPPASASDQGLFWLASMILVGTAGVVVGRRRHRRQP